MFNLKTVFWLLFVLATLALGTYFYLSQEKIEVVDEYVTSRKIFEEAVQMTGRVQPSQEANISFEKNGAVRAVYVKIGEVVKEGDVLAVLSNQDVKAKVLEAQAAYSAQKALLQDVSTGSRQETVENKQISIDKNRQDLEQAFKNAGDTLSNLAIYGNTYVRDNLATNFSGSLQNGYKLNISSCDSAKESQVEQLKAEAEKSLIQIENLQNEYKNFGGDSERQKEILYNIKANLAPQITNYLTALKDIYSLQCLTINSNYDSTRSTVFAARSGWSAQFSDLSSKINLINSAENLLSQSQNDLQIASTGEKPEKISQQKGNVDSAYARLLQAQADAEKHILRAPFAGVVTNVDMKVGELVTAGSKSISLISQDNFEIESKVSEVDVAKLSIKAKAQITFDAYGDSEKFTALVTNISPAGIISEGVPTFKTVFTFTDKSDLVRSGMTANIKVVTKVNESAISIPAKYIYTDNGDKFVWLKTGADNFSKRIVKVNGVGVDGNIEILEGLNENEIVVYKK